MSETREPATPTWGPGACRASVSVTFDNLGEAADLERGLWPEAEPLGRHFSVRRMLPRILEMLDGLGLGATFFVEGLNAELYPQALLQIASSGHEIGYHGWRHEYWPDISPSREIQLLERGVEKMDEIGVRPRVLRPPGGRLTPSSPGLLEDLGFTHCSPAGSGIGALGGLVVLPFEWRILDAYYYLPRFGELRRRNTGSEAPMSPARFGETLNRALQTVVREGGHLTLVFHPYLEEPEERFHIMRRSLEKVRDLAENGLVWCAPYREMVAWVRKHPEVFRANLQLDLTET